MTNEIKGLLGPSVGYVDLMDAELMRKQEVEVAKPPRKNPLRPSAAGYCARALAYQFNEYRGKASYPPDIKEPNILRLLDLGSSIEYNVLRAMGSIEYFQVKYKQQVLDFFPISETEVVEGSIDFVVYIPEHRAIGDVKSKGDKWSNYRNSKWDEELDKLSSLSTVSKISEQAFWVEDLPAFLKELNDPFFADNFVQLNMYACNEFAKKRNIDHAFILRYNKNNSKLMEVRFKPSQEVYDYVQDKFQGIARTIDGGGAPEEVRREYEIGSMRCAFCRFKDNCWPEADAKKAYFKTFPRKDWPTDIDRMDDEEAAAKLEELYKIYLEAQSAVNASGAAEEKLLIALRASDIDKVRFKDGNIYEVKFLKSPKPHTELRRSKI